MRRHHARALRSLNHGPRELIGRGLELQWVQEAKVALSMHDINFKDKVVYSLLMRYCKENLPVGTATAIIIAQHKG